MKRILLLTTGGTIASRMTEEGLAPGMDGDMLAHYMGGLAGSYDLTVKDILHLVGLLQYSARGVEAHCLPCL